MKIKKSEVEATIKKIRELEGQICLLRAQRDLSFEFLMDVILSQFKEQSLLYPIKGKGKFGCEEFVS